MTRWKKGCHTCLLVCGSLLLFAIEVLGSVMAFLLAYSVV